MIDHSPRRRERYVTHHEELVAFALPPNLHDPAVRRVVHNLWLEVAE